MFSLTANPQNRCVSRTLTLNNQPSTTYFLYDGWQLAEEFDGSGVEQALYVSGANVDELLYKATSAATVFYQHDGLGSTTALTDANGNLVERYTYDVFGKPSFFDANNNPLTASAYGNRFLYTGREYLQEVGLYDYRNRVYSADLGRFLQADPMQFSAGDVNVYRYCGNSPLSRIDSSGEISWPSAQLLKAIAAAISLAANTAAHACANKSKELAQDLADEVPEKAIPSTAAAGEGAEVVAAGAEVIVVLSPAGL